MSEKLRRVSQRERFALSSPETREITGDIFKRGEDLFRLAENVFPEESLPVQRTKRVWASSLFFVFNFGVSEPRSVGIWGYREYERDEQSFGESKLFDEYYKFLINFELSLEDETDLDPAQFSNKGLQFAVLKRETGEVETGIVWWPEDYIEALRVRFEAAHARFANPPTKPINEIPLVPSIPFLERMNRRINRPVSGIRANLFPTEDLLEALDPNTGQLINWETRPVPR